MNHLDRKRIMSEPALNILIVEDSTADYLLVERQLRQDGIEAVLRRVERYADLDAALIRTWDIALSDYNLPGMDFAEVLQRIHRKHPDLPVILVSNSVGEETAIDLLRMGLSDFVLKHHLIRLAPAIRRCLMNVEQLKARETAEAALAANQRAMLNEQRQARIAALNLMEDALAARRKAESAAAALRESEQRLLMAQEGAHVGIWEWDMTTNRLFWSPELERLYGVEPGSAPQFDDWRNLILPDDRDRIDTEWKQQIAGGDNIEIEFRIRRKDGDIRWIHSKGRVIRGMDGGPIRMSGVNLDITERRDAEAKLRQLSLAVEQSPECIAITDLQSRYEYVNDAFLQTNGYSRDEVIGRTPELLHSGKTPRQTYDDMWATLNAGKTWKGEFINRRKDGSEYVEHAIISPLRQADGCVTHYVAVEEDITEKKRIGHELDRHRHHLQELVDERTHQLSDAKEDAERANRAKSAFLANMSHEIRTPMNAIIGLTHLLRRDCENQHQADRLTRIEGAAQHLLSIVNDILDLSKIEAGRLELEHKSFALPAVFDHVRSMVSEAAKAKGLAVEVDLGGAPDVRHLTGDLTRLRQALLNFASNAVKFTDKGKVTLRGRLLEADGDRVRLRFEVEDTGIGIEGDVLPRLFQAFEQADVSTTRRYGGTGLGLAIARRLAALMGGEAGAESVPGQGSTFWFTAWLERGHGALPTAPAEPETAAPMAAVRHFAGTVLLAEDNPLNREVALEFLQMSGLTVETADDGRIALTKAANRHFDLILMDVQMPVMDGLEATRAIRARAGGETIPIVAMTANAFDEDRHVCLAAGMNDFIGKPIQPEEFFTTLAKWLPSTDGATAPPCPPAPQPRIISPQPTSASAEALVLECLASVEGLDLKAGLLRLGGKTARYLDFLKRFIDVHAEDVPRLRELLETDQRSEATMLAHSLKGSASTLSLDAIADHASRVEQALRGGLAAGPEELREHVEVIGRHMAALRTALAIHASPEAETPSRSLQQHALIKQISRLDELLTSSDTAAIDLFERHEQQFREIWGPGSAELKHQIRHFDFPGARQTLHRLKTSPASKSSG
jgi:PAS domain S-box-containing protein